MMNAVDPQNSTAGGAGDDHQVSFPAQVRRGAFSAIRRLCILGLAVIVAGLHAAEPAASTSQPPMLSGCEVDYPPYCVPKDGKADGFSVELLRAVLMAVGQTVSFKVADPDEIMQDLVAGRLQVLPMVSRTPEREALYDFTSPYLTMHGCIVVREDNADIHSTADLKGKQVATAREKYAEEYLRRANLGAVIVPLPSFATALQELSGGKYDAVVVQRMVALRLMRQAGIHNLRVISPPIPDFLQAACFAVSKGDSARLALLNEGLATVMADGTYQQLYAQWFPVIATAARSRPLIVACDADFPPFTFSQPDTTVDGFAVALWKAVAKEQGLSFELRVRPWGQLMDEFKAGQVDVLICAAASDERRQFARFSLVYSTDHGAIFVRTDETHLHSEADLVGKSIIVVKGDLAQEYSMAQGWQKQLVLVDQAADGFRLLASGQHDALLISRIVGARTLEKEAITNVHALSAKAGAGRAFSFAVQRDDVDLLATLNEGLAVCKANGTYEALYDKWLGVYDEKEISLLMVMRHIWPYLVGSLIVVLGLVIGLQYRRQMERRGAGLALQKSERRYAMTLAAVNDGLWDWDIPSGGAYFSPLFYAVLDYPDGAFSANYCAWRQLMHPEDLDRVEADLQRSIVSGEEVGIDLRMRTASGAWRWVMTRGKVVERDTGGKVRRMVGTICDITARKQTEEALRQSEENLAITLQSIGDAVITTDATGLITRINRVAETLIGYSSLAAQGRLLSEVVCLVDALSRVSIASPIDRILLKETTASASASLNRTILLCHDGRERIITHSASLICDVNGTIRGVVLVLRDITEQITLEEHLRQAENLQSLGRLAGGIAHDFNNMLAIVMGATDVIRIKSNEDPALARPLQMLTETVSRAGDLTAKLLDFARNRKIRNHPVDLHRECRTLVEILQQTIDPRITIVLDLGAFSSWVLGDPALLQNALLNLCLNARDAMPEGGTLTISTRAVPASAPALAAHRLANVDHLVVIITDTGIGMPVTVMDHLFEPFFSTKEIGKGTGLGLASTYGSVQEHHGAIEVKSKPGHGTTFRIWLPVTHDRAPVGKEFVPVPSPSDLRGQTILIADDEYALRMFLALQLEALGATVVQAEDGIKAIAAFTAEPGRYSLVILDQRMPGCDGATAFRAIRALRPGIRVLMASGYLGDSDLEELKSEGLLGFLPKPYTNVDLQRFVTGNSE